MKLINKSYGNREFYKILDYEGLFCDDVGSMIDNIKESLYALNGIIDENEYNNLVISNMELLKILNELNKNELVYIHPTINKGKCIITYKNMSENDLEHIFNNEDNILTYDKMCEKYGDNWEFNIITNVYKKNEEV